MVLLPRSRHLVALMVLQVGRVEPGRLNCPAGEGRRRKRDRRRVVTG